MNQIEQCEYGLDGVIIPSLRALEAADPVDLWLSHYSRIIDGGYPGDGCVVDDLIIATSCRGGGLSDLKHEARIYITRRAAVEEWHGQLIQRVREWIDQGWDEDLHEVLSEIEWPEEAVST